MTASNDDHAMYPLAEVGKRGYLIVDADGNSFADHMSAWGASPFGPTPMAVKQAMESTWDRHGMQISGWLPNQAAFSLVEKLSQIAPGRLNRVEYSVSGTLAVEGAVKFMREATRRPLIITFGGQYHGESTYMTAGASSDLSNVSTGRTQFVSGVVMVPYPNRFRSPFRRGAGPVDECEVLDYLDYLLVQQVHPGQVAGVLIEPVLGEGGIHGRPSAFGTASAHFANDGDGCCASMRSKPAWGAAVTCLPCNAGRELTRTCFCWVKPLLQAVSPLPPYWALTSL
jgi:4-aminobutyrate aminotransferase/4-aminobutyrate aminotransferase/(S)-3-amino-2-methylpropionate transaminase